MLHKAIYQGEQASNAFNAKIQLKPIEELYGKSVEVFCRALDTRTKTQSLLDIGSYDGQFLSQVLKELKIKPNMVTALEPNEHELQRNTANEKIIGDLLSTDFGVRKFESSMMRYVLHQNAYDIQCKMIEKIISITSDIAIIQHAGMPGMDAKKEQSAFDALFSGKFAALKRTGQDFTPSSKLESFFRSRNFNFNRIESRVVHGISEVFSIRYGLSETERGEISALFEGVDSIEVTTWKFPCDLKADEKEGGK